MQKPIRIDIDTLNDSKVYKDNCINQGDTLNMTINVFQGSQSLNLSGQTIHIIIKRSTGFSVEMVTGDPRLSVSNNTITAIFKDDYLCTDAIGDTIGEITLIDADGESSTNKFHFEVQESLANDIVVKMADELDTLKGIKELIDDYNGNADNLAIQNALAIQNKTDLIQLNSDGTALANRLETDITNGTQVAVRLETDITNGTTLANRLETDIATANVTDNKIQISITKGNEVIANLSNADWPKIWETIQSILSFYTVISDGMEITDENGISITDENGIIITM